VPAELFEFWEERDPINKFERFLKERGIITASGIEICRSGSTGKSTRHSNSRERPVPGSEDCLKDVYYEGE